MGAGKRIKKDRFQQTTDSYIHCVLSSDSTSCAKKLTDELTTVKERC